MKTEEKLSRREFSRKMIGTALSVTLLETIFSGCSGNRHLEIPTTSKVIETKAIQELNHWAVDLNEFCADLRADKITQAGWRRLIDKLFGRIELKDILQFIDFEKLTENFKYPDLGVTAKKIEFPKLDGLPEQTVFVKKIFGLRKDRAIIPHGHSNMVSAHLILDGAFSLKQYDKIKVEKDHLIIKPTVAKQIKAGDYSSISDDRDNVHWFVADTDRAFTFDVIITDLSDKKYDIHNIDIANGKKTNAEHIKVPKLDVQKALEKYGKNHHPLNKQI